MISSPISIRRLSLDEGVGEAFAELGCVDMLSHADIDAIVDAYGQAAERARRCGFDGVELHMAHAYTLSSFLSRLNARRDEYGGSLENRLRFPLRVLRRVRETVAPQVDETTRTWLAEATRAIQAR